MDSPSIEAPASKTLCVFDFDLTIVNEDCDEYVLKKLSTAAYREMLLEVNNPDATYPDIMHEQLWKLQEQGVTFEGILEALEDIPLVPGIVDVLEYLSSTPRTSVYIVSNANTSFITHLVKKKGLEKYLTGIISNEGDTQNGRFHVRPLCSAAAPHGCGTCARNMCKRQVVKELQQVQSATRVVYVGDGNNDYCPSSGLDSASIVFPRQGYGLHHRMRDLLASFSSQPGAPFMSLTPPSASPLTAKPANVPDASSKSSASPVSEHDSETESKCSDSVSLSMSSSLSSKESLASRDLSSMIDTARGIEAFVIPQGPRVSTWRDGVDLLTTLKSYVPHTGHGGKYSA